MFTLPLSWLMIFNLSASIVPSFISDSNTSSGVITDEDESISAHTLSRILFYFNFFQMTKFLFQFKTTSKRKTSLGEGEGGATRERTEGVWEREA
jgi:hypothetical protein